MARDLTTRNNQGGNLATRGQQAHPIDLFRREMDSLFSRFFGGGWLAPFEGSFGQTQGLGLDVQENDNEMVVRADVPGFEENELDVRLENDLLTVKAEKEQKGDNQREYRSFFRQVTLPPGIDADKVQASYRNGVLELHMPRPEGSRAKRIQIQGQRAATGGQQAVADKSGGNGGNGSHAGEQATSQKAKK